MTVLVTGDGLIGRLTADLLVERGDKVVIADLHPSLHPGGCERIVCDVSDTLAVQRLVSEKGIKSIVHTAAMLSTGIRRDPRRGVEVNIAGTANILDAALRHGVRRVVCASSTTVGYAAFGTLGAEPVPEDIPHLMIGQRPASIYAMTKLAGEHMGLLYADMGLDVVMLRYAAVLGGGAEPPTSVPGRLLGALATAGRSGRRLVLDDPYLLWGGREEFVDARDCALANLAALDAREPLQRVYNIATGDWTTLDEFVEAARTVFPALNVILPQGIETGFAGFPHKRPAPSSTQAAEQELGFRARHSLVDTIGYWTARDDAHVRGGGSP
ncbi:MAG: NAD(P)-dependent oxidoreductase [Gammaproteobacteria bacterium]|nr:NAD(P)-dependent oxidoreductase [Gammaproteobacteria bacterium]